MAPNVKFLVPELAYFSYAKKKCPTSYYAFNFIFLRAFNSDTLIKIVSDNLIDSIILTSLFK